MLSLLEGGAMPVRRETVRDRLARLEGVDLDAEDWQGFLLDMKDVEEQAEEATGFRWQGMSYRSNCLASGTRRERCCLQLDRPRFRSRGRTALLAHGIADLPSS